MDRDFDMEKVIDKMKSLRDARELELFNHELEKADSNPDTEKQLPDNKVLNVKYLGSIEIEGEEKGIYLVLEQKQKEDGILAEIERYYTEDGEFLGGNNKADQFDFLLLNEKYSNQEGLLEKLQSLDKEGILYLNQLEQDRLEEIALALGVGVEELDKVTELDLKQEIELEREKREGKETLNKKQVKNITSKTEIKTNQKVTDKETIASILKVEDKNYTAIDIIYSDIMENSGSTSRFAIVGIKEDGTAEKIDTLEQGYGTNPTKEIQSLNRDGSEIEQKQVNSIFKIKGEDETQIAVDIGSMGTIEPTLVRTPRQDNEEAISIPIETHSIKPTTRETRELMNEQRNPRVKEEIQRAKAHEELGCEEVSIKDINDNLYDDTHEHIEIDSEYIEKCVDKILENDEIAENYNRNDIKEKLKEQIEKSNETLLTEELIETVEKQMEETAKREHQSPQKGR